MKLPLFMLHISYMGHFNILLCLISLDCQQLRWVQSISQTSHNKNNRYGFIFTALPFYFSADILQVKWGIINHCECKKQTWYPSTHGLKFFSLPNPLIIGRWEEKEGDGNWKWKGEHQTLSLIKHEILAWYQHPFCNDPNI